VTSDPDIFRAAKLLIDQHGIDAPIRTARRANDFADEGESEAARFGAVSSRRSAS